RDFIIKLAGFYFFLLLPEIIWVAFNFNVGIALGIILFGLNTALLFHSLLYWINSKGSKEYLQWVFGLFCLFFILIMFKLLWLLLILSLAIALRILHQNYYPKN
ncbi:hypothetical protein, partial [Xanthovirga aplysinae]|uniref:hypothetical protein n=1 Tax=Xanthovirga aplysinae TaxID=2529853 RepID=UPI001CA41D20